MGKKLYFFLCSYQMMRYVSSASYFQVKLWLYWVPLMAGSVAESRFFAPKSLTTILHFDYNEQPSNILCIDLLVVNETSLNRFYSLNLQGEWIDMSLGVALGISTMAGKYLAFLVVFVYSGTIKYVN